MGSAILKGWINSGAASETVYVYDADQEKAATMSTLAGVVAVKDMQSLVDLADTIIIALKPNAFDTAIPDLAACVSRSNADAAGESPVRLFVSIAAGISIAWLESALGPKAGVVRVMPNTPAMIGCGMAACSRNGQVSDAQYEAVMQVFSAIGRIIPVDEAQMDVVIGISGSSPAYTYMYLQALICAGVRLGLSEADARVFAAQSAMGAAKMVLETSESPEQLRINVCSPGGTTIEAVHVLEKSSFMDIVEQAVDAAAEKSRLMTR
jgi:pyrroline-5-carboxylate reductase